MKRPLVLLLLVLMTAAVWAQQISEEQARDRALKYLTANDAAQSRGMKVAMDRKLVRARTDAKRIYAFNLEGGGYVIASGDSRALPVLGYSATGTIDWDRMPDNMRAWLKSYDEAMATLGDTKAFADGVSTYGQKTRAPREAIDPLIKTQWNQLEPYWNDTPPYDGANPDWQGQPSLTGCVATAMAMVMNYYQWPKEACTEIPAYDLTTAHENVEKVWHIDALPPTTFDWDQMLDNYMTSESTPEQQAAVAKLMRYCGQACKMEYTPEFSGSTPQYVVEALIRYFGYQNTVHVAHRMYYSIDGWEDLVYQELANGRPVQYCGNLEPLLGHAFVCDGYDGNGLFHMNWGWGGYYDGYFSLSVLNPFDNKAISGLSSIGYCMGQDAVIGVQPDKDGTSPKTFKPLAYLYDERPVWVEKPDTASFKYIFTSDEYSQKDVRMEYAFGTRADDGILTPLFKGNPADSIVKNGTVKSCYVKVDSTAFQPGEWMALYPMIRFRNIPDSDWQMLGSEEYRVIAGRMDDGQFYLFREMSDLEITKAEFTRGPGRMGMGNGLTLTVRNKSDRESTMPLCLVPYYYGKVKPEDVTADTPCSEGDVMEVGAYLRANQDTEITYSFKPLASGTIGMKLALPEGTPLAHFFIEVSDTIGSYIDYLVNQSTYELLPRQVAYHVCIADNPEANIPQGVPSDGIYFFAGLFDENGEVVQRIKLTDEAIDYLKALPEKAGDGNYTLTAELIVDIPRSGYYYLWSFFNEWLDDGTYIDGGAEQREVFYFELDETGIVSVTRVDKDDSRYVGLNGISTNTRPARKGIYIRNGKKILVK